MSGTTVLAGTKELKKLGMITNYHWGFTLNDLILGVGHDSPATIGVRWYSGMYRPDKDGYIHVRGRQTGGHCITVIGVDVELERFTLLNSWGSSWGINGTCYISFDDMQTLLKRGGEVLFLEGKKNIKIDEPPYDGGHDPVKWKIMLPIPVRKIIQWIKERIR